MKVPPLKLQPSLVLPAGHIVGYISERKPTLLTGFALHYSMLQHTIPHTVHPCEGPSGSRGRLPICSVLSVCVLYTNKKIKNKKSLHQPCIQAPGLDARGGSVGMNMSGQVTKFNLCFPTPLCISQMSRGYSSEADKSIQW